MRETLGNRMSKKLKEYGISQRLLATLTRTTEVSVSRYVNDKRIPKADVLYRIACALHTTTDYLLGLTTSEQTNEEWLKSLDTEQLAEFISKIDMPFMDKAPFPCGDLIECNKNCGLYSRCVKDDFPTNKEVWVEWLKQPHQKE